MAQGIGIVDRLYDRLRLPVIVAPMFLVSGPDLIIASAKAGLIGGLPTSNARTLDDLALWLEKISRELRAVGKQGTWVANMIVHPSYHRFDAELDLMAEYKPLIVVTALGNPSRVMDRIHSYGGSVFSDVITVGQARKAVDAGADGLVLVAAGAGGHTGTYSPFAFVEEVRRFWSGPLVIGGAIAGGRSLRAALTLGADFAYMGTRFIATRESLVSDEHKAMVVRATLPDIILSSTVTGVAANWMRESLETAGVDLEKLAKGGPVDFSDIHGQAKLWKDVWSAGHGVGRTEQVQNVEDIVDELVAEYASIDDRAAHWPNHAGRSATT